MRIRDQVWVKGMVAQNAKRLSVDARTSARAALALFCDASAKAEAANASSSRAEPWKEERVRKAEQRARIRIRLPPVAAWKSTLKVPNAGKAVPLCCDAMSGMAPCTATSCAERFRGEPLNAFTHLMRSIGAFMSSCPCSVGGCGCGTRKRSATTRRRRRG